MPGISSVTSATALTSPETAGVPPGPTGTPSTGAGTLGVERVVT